MYQTHENKIKYDDLVVLIATVIYCFVIACFFLPGHASAYYLKIYCADKIPMGIDLDVTISCNIPVGTTVPVNIYDQQHIGRVFKQNFVTIQRDGESRYGFAVTRFNTDDMAGEYKVEVPEINGYKYMGDSKSTCIINIVDTSSRLHLTSPLVFDGNYSDVYIAGKVDGNKNEGILIRVIYEDGGLIYPKYNADKFSGTDRNGNFNVSIGVCKPGKYDVTFIDKHSYITQKVIVVNEIEVIPITTVPTTVPTTAPTIVKTPSPTTVIPNSHEDQSFPGLLYGIVIIVCILLSGYLIYYIYKYWKSKNDDMWGD